MGSRRSVEELLHEVKSGDWSRQYVALKELVRVSALDAAPMLLESMDSPDVSVRCAVASALGYLGKKHLDEVGSVLVRHLDDDDPLVRSEVIDALAALEYADSVAPLRRKLQDADSLVRASAAEALGDLNEPTALQDLVNAFADSDEAVRAFSVRAYGLLAPSGQTLALAERSKLEPSSFVLAELEAARCRLDETSTLEPVLEALRGADEALAVQILNTIDDLFARRTPAVIVRESAQIRHALEDTARQFPLLRGQTEEMLAQIPQKPIRDE